MTQHLLGGSNGFLQKSPQRVRPLLTSTKTAQMPLDLRSNDLQARITVASSCDSTLCFLARESMRCSRTVDSMMIRVHRDLTAHSRRYECFCNIRLREFGNCAESTSTTDVPLHLGSNGSPLLILGAPRSLITRYGDMSLEVV